MSTIGDRRRALRAGRGLPPAVSRAVLLAALGVGAVAGVLAGAGGATDAVAAAGPELTRLLRAMAAIKMLLAGAAAAGMWWRLGGPAGWAWLFPYALAGGAMAAGPGLIWGIAHVGAGAMLLHGGLAAAAVLLWRDPGTGVRLAAALERRRARVRVSTARG